MNGQRCQGTIVHTVAANCCHALLDTLLQLLRSRTKARSAQQCQGTFVRTAAMLVVVPIVCAAAVVATTKEGKEWPTIPRHRRPLCRQWSTLPPLLLSHEQTRVGQQCWQGTIFCSAADVIMYRHPCCHNQCCCMSKQGMGQCQGTVVHAVATVVILCPHCCHHRHCAQLFTPLPSLPSQERAMNGQGCCQGTIFCSAAIVVVHCHVIHAATIDAFARASKEWPTMSRHCCPCCRHCYRGALSFALLP